MNPRYVSLKDHIAQNPSSNTCLAFSHPGSLEKYLTITEESMALTILPHTFNSEAFTARLHTSEKPIPLFNLPSNLYFPSKLLQKHSNLPVNINSSLFQNLLNFLRDLTLITELIPLYTI